MRLSETDIILLRQLLEDAHAGPWEILDEDDEELLVQTGDGTSEVARVFTRFDALLIAWAPVALSRLVAEVQGHRAEESARNEAGLELRALADRLLGLSLRPPAGGETDLRELRKELARLAAKFATLDALRESEP